MQHILPQTQYGFRSKTGTNHLLYSLIKKVIENLEAGKHCKLICIDFSKCFDTVNHSILIKKLQQIGLGPKAINWFKSYLYKRKKMYTKVNGTYSTTTQVVVGVPQGTVLGPLIYLIYSYDIKNLGPGFSPLQTIPQYWSWPIQNLNVQRKQICCLTNSMIGWEAIITINA